ncbi:hypothetical protein CL621_03510 [archaeon]|nr:hypothetical protein [archaeon]|tara:strand:- start:2077 stop:2835 length:759 start_codon:yes stop_codon:yes gene_type:complete
MEIEKELTGKDYKKDSSRKKSKKIIRKGVGLLAAATLSLLVGKNLAGLIHKNQDIENIVENEQNYVNINLDGKNYTFDYSDKKGKIDSIVVEWNGTKEAKHEGKDIKYDIGNLYFLNFDNKTCYRKVPVVGGIYSEDEPSSPHNDKMIAGGYVANPSYALKNIQGGDPKNPFGVGLTKLYDISDKYSVEEMLGFIDTGGLNFPEKHDERQLHGNALINSNLGYTLGCVRIANEDMDFLGDYKNSIVPMYFNN